MTIETLLAHFRQITPESGNGVEITPTTLQLARLHDITPRQTQTVIDLLVAAGIFTRPDWRDPFEVIIPPGATIPKSYDELMALPPKSPDSEPNTPPQPPITPETRRPGIRLSEI